VKVNCRPPLAVVQKRTYAEQKRRKRISFLAEIEEPDSYQNAYHGHCYYFEHGVGSGAISDRARSAWQRASFRKCAVGQQRSEHAKHNGKPAKYEHYLILMRSQLTATLTLNGG
jgi:hypothetical protein